MDLELKYKWAFVACIALAAIYILFSFVKFVRKSKYKGGAKVVEPEYLKDIPYYKQRLMTYKFLKVVLIVTTITSLLLSGYLMARPSKLDITETQHSNRDIILCLDISTSVDALNANLVKELEGMVEELHGERFGIVIFNTSPLLLCPLTTDYEYVISILENLNEGLELRDDYYNGSGHYSERLAELDAWMSNGTLVNNLERGSSIIGDGLAGGTLAFSDIKENPDRTRIMIFTTDNDCYAVYGKELFTLPEAGELCQKKNIIVYGIGTDFMYPADKKEMKEVVESTNGAFFIGEDSKTISKIVANIREQAATLDNVTREISEKDLPETPFKLMLISIALMMVLAWFCKV